MYKTTNIALLLISLSAPVNGQEFIDQILLKTGDTIACEITLVNDQNIFYACKMRRTKRHYYVSLGKLLTYKWASQDIKNQNPPESLLPLYDSTDTWQVGIKLSQHYNYTFMHTVPALSFSQKNHDLSLGLDYAVLLKENLGDPIDDYVREYWGLNLSYRYIFNSSWEKTNLFLQTNFSIFQVRFKENQLGPPYVTERKNLIVENTVGLGVNYQFYEHFELFGGIGFGSTNGFFLMIDQFVPHAFWGVEYKF